MFNIMRRCLIVSVRTRKKFLTRVPHEGISSELRSSSANTLHFNNVIYKRFYCHAVIDDQNLTSFELTNLKQKLDQQKLEELLSDPENKKRFQILELEVDVLRHNAERVPTNIKPKDWLVLLNSNSKSKRKKYLDFLWRNEKSKENEKAKKEFKKAQLLARLEKEEAEEDTGAMKYGLLNNSLFMRIYDTTINRFYNGKLIQGMMFEPKIVFDCGYESEMTQREIHNCAKQLSLAFADNRNHVNPLFFYFCNFNKDGLLRQYLQQNIPIVLQDDFPVEITSQSYLDVFPKDQLVYLTPHCRVNLTEYDPDAVYIIGALVDKSDARPLSMAKAKREGIRMAKFPIDKYLDWGHSSSKSLTLNQTINIMLDLRHTGNWKNALEKNVPSRKLKSSRDYVRQKKEDRTRRSMLSDTTEIEEPRVPVNFTFQRRKMN